MRVVGIDQAPTKGLDVFDGSPARFDVTQARTYVTSLQEENNVLICWDSPLTGPPPSVVDGAEANRSAFSQRLIESFFSKSDSGFKTPKGISVRPYSGCPHWALSRSLLGLPRVGPFDASGCSLPFHLLTDDRPPCSGRHVVEVHPAVALWVRTREYRDPRASWAYKKSPQVLSELWGRLARFPAYQGHSTRRHVARQTRTTSWMRL